MELGSIGRRLFQREQHSERRNNADNPVPDVLEHGIIRIYLILGMSEKYIYRSNGLVLVVFVIAMWIIVGYHVIDGRHNPRFLLVPAAASFLLGLSHSQLTVDLVHGSINLGRVYLPFPLWQRSKHRPFVVERIEVAKEDFGHGVHVRLHFSDSSKWTMPYFPNGKTSELHSVLERLTGRQISLTESNFFGRTFPNR